MTFGEKLKFYRKKKNITQRDLAKTAGLGFNTISNYERGQTYPQNREI
ncbi:MAG: helix-turn-helix transcriptional regulator, partial [Clostridia bacterium]|nr:helix-turn-helix transcriptional regulator [Clostridia bacterium]